MNRQITKTISYFILGVLPATFWSIFWLSLMSSSAKIAAYILTLAILSGTIGLYIITFSNNHNSKIAATLLFIGQIVMVFIIIDLGMNTFPSYTGLIDVIKDVFRLLIIFGPIVVALHYQFTVYKRWKFNKSTV